MSEVASDINPRNNTHLLGHESEEKFFMEAFKNRTLHNSILISGIEGIGKATFAYKMAKFMLNDTKLVSNNAHPDMKVLERDYTDTDRKKIMKAIKGGEKLSDDDLKDMKKSAFIRVDDVRTINDFLSKRASNDGYRVVLVDSVDEMNTASSNAMLKFLEEPPHNTIIMLISHNPDKLLPTIKSRCAKIQLKPLENEVVASLLRRYRSALSEAEIKDLAKLSEGSIGKAILYADTKAFKHYNDLLKIVAAGNRFSIKDLLSFVDSATADESLYALAKELVFKVIGDNIRSLEKVEDLGKVWSEALKIFDEVERLNMDKKQAMINVITNICKVV